MSRAQTATAYDSLKRAFEVEYSAGNSAGLGQLFTADSELMPPDGPVVKGRDDIVASLPDLVRPHQEADDRCR